MFRARVHPRIVVAFALLGLTAGHEKWGCVHDHLETLPAVRSSQAYATHKHSHMAEARALQETGSTPQKIRITAYMQQLENDVADRNVKDYIKDTLIPKAIQKMSNALKVLPIQGPLFFARGCEEVWKEGEKRGGCKVARTTESCGSQRSIPREHLGGISIWGTIDAGQSWVEDSQLAGSGIEETDLLIYVTGVDAEACARGEFVATYSGVCQRDQQDRPVVGYINFCPDRIEATAALSKDEQVDVLHVAHELTHILGFSRDSFSYFRDEFGSPRTPRCPAANGCSESDDPGHPPQVDGRHVIATSTLIQQTERGGAVERVVSPAVQEIARIHYGCPDLQGAELENSLSLKNPSASHWEKRVLMTDLMTSLPDLNPTGDVRVVSAFTLALLQDSGWYEVDYGAAGSLKWGAALGCEFARDKCDPADTRAWCSPTEEDEAAGSEGEGLEGLACTFDGRGLGACDIQLYPSMLPAANRYFGDDRLGGVDDLMDYCPRLSIREEWLCNDPSTNQPAAKWTKRCDQGACRSSTFGPGSICLSSTLEPTRSNSSFSFGCYRARCSDQAAGRVELLGPDGAWHACTEGSPQPVSIPGFAGLVCAASEMPTKSQLRPEGLSRIPLRLLTSQDVAFVASSSEWRGALVLGVSAALDIVTESITIEAVCGVGACAGENYNECEPVECEALGSGTALSSRGKVQRGSEKALGVAIGHGALGVREQGERHSGVGQTAMRERAEAERESAWEQSEGWERGARRAGAMGCMVRLALAVAGAGELRSIQSKIRADSGQAFALTVSTKMGEDGFEAGELAIMQDNWMVVQEDAEATAEETSDMDEKELQSMLRKVGIYSGVALGVLLICCGCCYCNRRNLGAKIKGSRLGEQVFQMSSIIASPQREPHAPYPNVLETNKKGDLKKPKNANRSDNQAPSPPRMETPSELTRTPTTAAESEAVAASKAYLDALQRYLRKTEDLRLKREVQEARKRAKGAWKKLQAGNPEQGALNALQKLQEDTLKGLGVSTQDVDVLLEDKQRKASASANTAARALAFGAAAAAAGEAPGRGRRLSVNEEEALKARMQMRGAEMPSQAHANLNQIPPATALQSAQYHQALKNGQNRHQQNRVL